MTRLLSTCEGPDGSTLILGEHDYPEPGEGGIFYVAGGRELARSWARDLRAGRIPSKAEPDPEPTADATHAAGPL